MNAISNAISLSRAASHAPRNAAAVREAVLAILPEIAARAGTTEADRRVPEENVALLREAGFFRLVQPRAFGGLEGEFADLVDLAIDVGSACTSTGWVCGLGAAHQWLVATFPLQAQHDVWDADPDTIVCGSYAPSGTVAPVEGGFRASGRWMFASGCDVSGWSVCGALLPPTEEGGKPTPAFLLVPLHSGFDQLAPETVRSGKGCFQAERCSGRGFGKDNSRRSGLGSDQ